MATRRRTSRKIKPSPGARKEPPTRRPAHLRRDAKSIFRAALASVRAEKVVPETISLESTKAGEWLRCAGKRFPLRPGGRLIVVGAGKASSHMARAAERLLGRRVDGGAVVTQRGHAVRCKRIEILEAGHPVPDEDGIEAARTIGAWIDGAGEEDLVLCLISGGGSALMPAPAKGVTLGGKRAVTGALLKSGATINALNCVRKHLSRLKGGHLARRTAPARLLTLAISDVIGDPLDVIASGPTCGDPTTFSDAERELKSHGIWKSLPSGIRRHLQKGIAGDIPETPDPADPLFDRVHNVVAANNETALRAAAGAARALGYRPMILTRRMQGEAREVGRFLAGLTDGVRGEGFPARPPVCLLLGGETTVTVRGKGIGGRCQELALSFLGRIADCDSVCLLSAGSDGRDGPSPAAGAIVDGGSMDILKKQGLDVGSFLSENDSYGYFNRFGGAFSLPPTGTNVMDIVVLLIC